MNKVKVDEKLDLRGEICPYNFVKAKLKLEEMEIGQILLDFCSAQNGSKTAVYSV